MSTLLQQFLLRIFNLKPVSWYNTTLKNNGNGIILFLFLLLSFGQLHAQTPTLGTYSNTTIIAGSNVSVTPSSAPTSASFTMAYTNTNFTGSITVNPATGVVKITNAKQVGSYNVTVKAFNGADSAKSSFTLTVLKGTCTDGTFASASSINVGNAPVATATVDFNNDDIQDIAVVNSVSKSVSILTGDGSGGFTNAGSVSVAPLVTSQPYCIAVGDFNGDGNQDFATGNWCDTGSVSVRFGNGNGTFSGTTELEWASRSTITKTRSIAVGDFNGDKIQDLAIASFQNNRVYVYSGNGSGGFTLNSTFGTAVGTGPYGIVIGDFNNDGKQDFATCNNTAGTISRCLGDGGGGFSVALTWTAVGSGSVPSNLAICDINNDGKQDLAVSLYSSNQIAVFRGNGNGSFLTTPKAIINTGSGSLPNSLAIADFNGDGRQDITHANSSTSGKAGVSLFTTDSFNFGADTLYNVGTNSKSVNTGDFNSDGIIDLVVTNSTNNNISILFGNPNPMSIDVQGNGVSIADGDATPDLANHTDFGAGVSTRNFTIKNTGSVVLPINNITLTGTHASDFSLSGIPSSIAINGSATFTVSFSSTGSGTRNATVHVFTPVCGKPDYDFAISGTDCVSPGIICSNDTTVSTGSTCNAIVNYNPKSVTGFPSPSISYAFTGATTGTGSGNGSGAAFNKGVTTVTLTATNNCGTATCAFTITVNDNTAPGITCVGNQTRYIGTTSCNYTALGTEFDAAVNDNCSGSLTKTNNINNNSSLAGASFSIGVNTVIWTVTDASNNTSTCSFTILIADNSNPSITCTGTQNRNTNAGLCTYTVVGAEFNPSFTDNCTGVSAINNFNNANTLAGAVLNKGSNTIVWTVTDASGNTTTCAVIINVFDTETPSITCGGNQSRNVNSGNCTYIAVGSEFNPSMADNCAGVSAINNFNNSATLAGALFNKGTTNVIWTVTDASGNTATCANTITVIDNQNPTINCVANQSRNTNSGICTYTAVGAEFNPTFADNCAGAYAVNNFNNASTLAGAVFNKGITTIIWTVTDASGNTATCANTITVNDNQNPIINCLANQSRGTTSCSYTAVGTEFNPSFSDNCTTVNAVNNYNNNASLASAVFNKGITTVIWTVTDAAGNTATCANTITVIDNQNPTINCIANQSRNANTGVCTYTADGAEFNPTFADNCAGVNAVNNFNNTTTLAGAVFNKGTTNVIWTVTDASGNTATCANTITVIDNQNPTINCVANQSRNVNTGVCSYTAVGAEFNPTFADNCAGVTAKNSINNTATLAGAIFNKGITTVIWTVTDASGNSATCSNTITVIDAIAPSVLTQNITVALSAGTATINASQINNGSTDNCGIASMNVTPSTFTTANIGSNTVTLTVTDVSGNTSTATAVVTITGTTSGNPPTVSITAMNQKGFCQGGYILLKTNATNTVSYLWSTGATSPNIEVKTSGTYTVTVKNSSGQSATASITINYNASNLFSAYTILSKEEIELKDGSKLMSGGAGVLSSCGEIEVEGNSKITAAGTFAKAKEIEVKSGSVVTNQIIGIPNVTLPSFKSNPFGNSTNNKTVGQNATVTLTDSVFDKVNLGKGSTVIFTKPVIYMNDLNLGEFSKVKFTSSCVEIRIRREFNVDKGSFINPDNKSVIIYSLRSVNVKKGSTVVSSIFSLSDIKANGECRDSVTMIGMFIAYGEVEVKNTVFYANPTCGTCSGYAKTSDIEPVADERGLISADKFHFYAYPNPSNGNFNLDFITPTSGKISVSVYDLTGKIVFESNHLESKGTLNLPVDLSMMPSGYYLVKANFNGEIYTKKMFIQAKN